MYHVYILQNPHNKFYIGHTNNLAERMIRHQEDRSPYTRKKGPWRLVYSESYLTRAQAYRREREIKRKKSAEYITKLVL